MDISRYRKACVAGAGAIALIVSSDLVHGEAPEWLTAILSVATALGVYAVPNRPQSPSASTTAPATGNVVDSPDPLPY